MAILEIPVQPGANVTSRIAVHTLDRKRYTFRFYTNTVDQRWYFNLQNADASASIFGIAITVGPNLLYPFRHLDLPQGRLFVRDRGLGGSDPNLESFGLGLAALYYQEAADSP